ncbi:Heat shock protein 70 family [Carpediemonas membranifera]|uniref:Heat shock protein 70 family n=1 Tax=Carpediemonas membranifera TaxID=201153 RepID=A0A8J6DZD3_9EUKA|nr:Heat shock protein 70 family [Carpediemonas membranifera]|eukprot:KAG9390563.1 Heat shock protein 70 family [Carpediemonas membranifera]
MPCLGIDFGSENLLVGIARLRGVDILVNEASNRATPACVTFDEKQRFIGEQANQRKNSKWQNTFYAVKQLIGRKYADANVQKELSLLPFRTVEMEDGFVGFCVNYLDTDRVFSCEQIAAMLLSCMRDVANADNLHKLGTVPSSWDAVITIPSWWDQNQRKSLLAAAEIAGLNCLQLLSEHAAAGVTWLRRNFAALTDKPVRMMLFDMGHASATCAIMSFTAVEGKASLVVEGVSHDEWLGGRSYDQILAQHFADKFEEKHTGVKIMENPKAAQRLVQGVQRVRKLLTANNEAPLNVECLINDLDLHFRVSREDLAALGAEVTARIEPMVRRALEMAQIANPLDGSVSAFEVIGGAARMPLVQDELARTLGMGSSKDLHQTLNNEECICNGAALQGAFISPHFRLNQTVAVHDYNLNPVTVVWAKPGVKPAEPMESDAAVTAEDLEQLMAFDRGCQVPMTRAVTFRRSQDFNVYLHYADQAALPNAGTHTFLAAVNLTGVKPTADGGKSKVKVHVTLDRSGVLDVSESTMEVTETYEEVVKKPKPVEEKPVPEAETTPEPAPEAGDEDVPMTEEESKEAPKAPEPEFIDEKVTKTRKTFRPLPMGKKLAGIPGAAICKYVKEEQSLNDIDRREVAIATLRNDLESFVYSMSDDLDLKYTEVTTEEERSAIKSTLMGVEDWLYSEEGEEATMDALTAKMDQVKALAAPIVEKYTALHAPPPPPEPKEEKEAEGEAEAKEGEAEAQPEEEGDVDME